MGLVVDFGIIGVAAATLMGPLTTDACLVQQRLRTRTGVSALSFYRQTVAPSALSLVVMVATQHALRRFWTLDHLWEVAAAEAINVVVFWSAFWWTGVSEEERKLVSSRVRRSLHREPAG